MVRIRYGAVSAHSVTPKIITQLGKIVTTMTVKMQLSAHYRTGFVPRTSDFSVTQTAALLICCCNRGRWCCC